MRQRSAFVGWLLAFFWLLGPTHPALAELAPVPAPDLSGLEEVVREQLAEERATLDAQLAQAAANPAALQPLFARLGRHYHAYGLAEAAAACYVNATSLDPRDVDTLYALGRLQQTEGRLEEAAATYAEALARRPRDPVLEFRLGEIELARNQLAAARSRLQKALDDVRTRAAANAALGQVALSEERYGDAVELLEAALREVPVATRLHHPLGLAYRGLGDLEKARTHLEARGEVGIAVDDLLGAELEALTRGERIQLQRGRRAFQAGRYQDAAAAFTLAVEASPRSARARVNLASALSQLGRPEAAEAELQKALELEPENPTAHFNLGVLLAARRDDATAVRHLQRAVDLAPEDGAARVALAGTLRRLGRSDEALAHYRQAITTTPDNEEARLGEAVLLVDQGRLREARERLEEAHQALPHAGRLAAALARLLAASPDPALRDGARALDLAQRVVAAVPSPEHAVLVALALAELGRCTEAANWQRQAIRTFEEAGLASEAAGLQSALTAYESSPCRPPITGPPDGPVETFRAPASPPG